MSVKVEWDCTTFPDSPTTYISQLLPPGGGVSGSTIPLRRAAPELSSGLRANSESLRRRWRAVLNGDSVGTSEDAWSAAEDS